MSEMHCPGCHALKGKPFWAKETTCDLYACASGKGLRDCGKCGAFPCETLQTWANTQEGENGQRIKNLQMREARAR
jgi:hypothetical protein